MAKLDVHTHHRQGDRRARRPQAFRLRVEPLELRCLLAANQFAVIGDYGLDNSNELAVSNLIKTWDPAYVITVGDNNYSDGEAATIDANIGKYFQEFIGNYTGGYGPGSATDRFFPSLGNHDWRAPGAGPYLDYFTLPGNERYYDFVQGPVHFFAIDSDDDEPDGMTSASTQAQWLQQALATSTSAFNVVYFHHPPYSSGGVHGSTTTMRWPFKEWGADAVLAGHEHLYERLDIGGIPYFVNGLGGASTYNFGPAIPGSQVRYTGSNGAMLATVDSASLTFEFYSINSGGTLIDRYTIASDLPRVSIGDATVTEGDSGTVYATFSLSLSAPSTETVTVYYATADGTATAGADYVAKSGTRTFLPGVTRTSIRVAVNGDTLNEMDETFRIELSSPTNATIADSQGIGTIIEDADGSMVALAFQDGVYPSSTYAGTRDTKIKRGTPTTNYGSSTMLEMDGSPDEASLLKWDLTAIPPGSTVESVSLTVSVANTTTHTYEIYELKRNWSESAATWNVAAAGNNWQVAGAQGSLDRGTTVLGNISSSLTGLTTVALNATGVALVQSWVNDGATNFGFIIQDYATASDAIDFRSSEVSTNTLRPKLSVAYLAPAATSSSTAIAAQVASTSPAAALRGQSPRRNSVDAGRNTGPIRDRLESPRVPGARASQAKLTHLSRHPLSSERIVDAAIAARHSTEVWSRDESAKDPHSGRVFDCVLDRLDEPFGAELSSALTQ